MTAILLLLHFSAHVAAAGYALHHMRLLEARRVAQHSTRHLRA